MSKEERLARLDIKYRQVAGKHVIVELKRPERLVSVHDLSKQIGKYRSGMVKLLQNIKRSNEPVEFICILGRPPQEWDDPGGQQVVENTLQAQNARHVTYDLLLDRSFRAYKDYLNSAKEISRLSEIMSALDRDETDASAK